MGQASSNADYGAHATPPFNTRNDSGSSSSGGGYSSYGESLNFITKKYRNLIKNPKADDELNEWTIVENGGHRWATEGNRKPFPDETVTKCFVTSFGLCLKQQVIDLQSEGYGAVFMDQMQPPIKISDWYAPRFDCGCQYEVCVELLNQRKNPIFVFQPEKVYFQQWNDEPWCQMTHVFKDYGPGVRFVRFTHGGKDTQFWAGHYGIRVTNSSVEIFDIMPALPREVVEEILLNVPAPHVVRVCRLVCSEWKELVDSNAHWKERCRREGFRLWDASRSPADWKHFYFITKKRRNLIKNHKAEDRFRGWNLVQNGGDLWAIGDNHTEIPNHTVSKYAVTSYRMCMKEQLINLKMNGYNSAFMDELQPHIKVSDWYGLRYDCGAEYRIKVQLLDGNMRPIRTFEPATVYFEQWTELAHKWHEITHVFKDYGPGVRFVRFTHGGVDTQFWAGHYGIRVTNSSVEICPAEER